MRLCATCALLGLLFVTAIAATGSLQTLVRPDKGSTVTVSTPLPPDQCAVCTVGGVNDTQVSCRSSLPLKPEEEVKLLFNCSQPLEKSYAVTISRTIDCTKDLCSPTTIGTQPTILPELIRTLTWEVQAPPKTVVRLDVLGEGLVEASQPCPTGFRYSVSISKTNPKGPTRYCRGGSVTHLDLLNEGVVALQVDPKAVVDQFLFKASAGPLKGRTEVITIDSSTTVVLSRDPAAPECDVCSAEGSTSNCSPTTKTLTNVHNLSLDFSCQQPQDVYTATVQRKIGCTTTSCSPAVAQVDPNLFKAFQRTLKWDISVPERTVLTLDFAGDGLKEVSGAGDCPGRYQYSLSTTKSDGSIKSSSYCTGGTVSQLDLQGATTVTVDVPKDGDLAQTAFSVRAAPRGSRTIPVTPEPKTTIFISRAVSEPDCSVCVRTAKPTCDPRRAKITDPGNISVEFTCPQPQHIYTVEINRAITCKSFSCSGDIVQAESPLFQDFNRTFTWDLKVVSPQSFQLDFSGTGMRQIPREETCPDEHTYSVVIYLHTGPADIGTFCKGGPVTTVLAPYKGRVTLQVPANRKVDPVDFKLNVGPETSMLAIVTVNLPRGVSDTDILTPNYPGGLPDAQQMQWNFTVPGMHNYTVQFLQSTAPECVAGDVEVEYQRDGRRPSKLTLTDPQPKHQQDNFNMVLRNCQTNTTLQGLSLRYRVSVMRSGHPVLCTVDLSKRAALSLRIENTGSDPYCEMRINSTVAERLIVAAGTTASLSFLDCPKEDVRLTASDVTECPNVSTCPTIPLSVPTLDSCLPMRLHSFTWNIRVPVDSTAELAAPTGSLRQALPGQECNPADSLNLADEDGISVGDYCYGGVIQKVQVHTNISVTARSRDFSKTSGPFLNVSFSQEISETIIYRVSPTASSPTLLATPNWPEAMVSFSSVSWIVDVPSRYQANVQFVNVSQPKCQDGHTSITVKQLGSEKELLALREDSPPVGNLSVPGSFYLTMSNCMSEEGHFGAAARIVLQETSNLLAIILGVVGALLLLLIVLVVICVIKKKKKGLNRDSSIFMGKGNVFRPSDNHFPKTRSEDPHIYTSIDDTMVYSHALGDAGYADGMPDHFKGAPVDSYRTFTGPTALPEIKEPDLEPEMDLYKPFLEPPQTFIPSRPRTPIDRQDSLGFQDRRMMDNGLFTFKSTGEINTIQLTDFESEPRLQTSEESF
ncbi:CUB domain-containing protein 1 [Betta splendens]|uniref:CUB domain-containing protein 1 n=1 Tax=Betta splendens TaxID=158456 RepID=A0A6P7NTJ5_BETSP|nr:CUB domain-containing protein 1 [Betta splendens]